MDLNIQAKLRDQIKTALGKENNPSYICWQSRMSCEAILKEIWKKEIGKLPPLITIQPLRDGLKKQKPELIPLNIDLLIGTIQTFGNKGSHPQENLNYLDSTHGTMLQSALGAVSNWFFNDYLNLDSNDNWQADIIVQTHIAQESNYKDLLNDILSDGILDIEEFEKLLDARLVLELSDSTATLIEKEVVNRIFKRSVTNLSELLSRTDLESFRKHDDLNSELPLWVNMAVQGICKSDDKELKYILRRYFPELVDSEILIHSEVLNLIGCWQGWYFQSSSKTYFDLVFIAINNFEFVGVSIEPINPTWNWANLDGRDKLLAVINGQLADDIIFSFKKTYMLETTWSIDYEGVILEAGKYFEGEWVLNSLNGPFNAMKTRSLLPIRIFDTKLIKPIVKTKNLNNYLTLTSSWFIQIQGKDIIYGLLHIIQIGNRLNANIIYSQEGEIKIDYLEGICEGSNNAILNNVRAITGVFEERTIRFGIDYHAREISGVIRDDTFKVRSIKGYKF